MSSQFSPWFSQCLALYNQALQQQQQANHGAPQPQGSTSDSPTVPTGIFEQNFDYFDGLKERKDRSEPLNENEQKDLNVYQQYIDFQQDIWTKSQPQQAPVTQSTAHLPIGDSDTFIASAATATSAALEQKQPLLTQASEAKHPAQQQSTPPVRPPRKFPPTGPSKSPNALPDTGTPSTNEISVSASKPLTKAAVAPAISQQPTTQLSSPLPERPPRTHIYTNGLPSMEETTTPASKGATGATAAPQRTSSAVTVPKPSVNPQAGDLKSPQTSPPIQSRSLADNLLPLSTINATETSKSEEIISPLQPPTTSVSTPATSAISTAATELGRQLSLQELYGDDFSKVTMKQGPYSNTCYLLATLGGIFHLPEDKAKAVLSRIKIYENGNQYQVQFPGQKKVITVTKEELENTFTVQSRKPGGKPWQATRVTSNAPGVRIIEAAYLKTIPSERVGYFSTPDLALQNIFGIPAYEATNIHNGKDLSGKVDDGNGYEEVVDIYGNVQKLKIADQMEHRAGQFESTHEGRHDLFKDFTLHANNDPSFADIATAIPIGGAHYYTIRLFESTPAQIVLADPFDFDNNFDSEKSIKVPFDVFMQNYNIEGIRLQLN